MNISIVQDIFLMEKNTGKGSLDLLFTGDFFPHETSSSLILQKNFEALFNDFLSVLHHADLAVTNLECPLTDKKSPIKKSGPVLKAPPDTAEALKHGNIGVACLANNHIMDYGTEGLSDTLKHLDSAGIQHVGAGLTLEQAMDPLIITRKGLKIGIINVAEHEFSIATDHSAGAAPIDEITNYYQIRKARSAADLIILVLHGGHEMYPFPSPRMVKLYRFYADLGADVIIGHHPHVFSGYEVYKRVPIFYSLGNFLFDAPGRVKHWYRGYAVYLKLSGNNISDIYLIPYSQFVNGHGISLLNIKEVAEFNEDILRYNRIISDEKSLNDQFKKYICEQRGNYLAVFLSMSRYKRRLLQLKFFRNLFFGRIRLLRLLNQFRCQSHRDVMTETLKHELNTK